MLPARSRARRVVREALLAEFVRLAECVNIALEGHGHLRSGTWAYVRGLRTLQRQCIQPLLCATTGRKPWLTLGRYVAQDLSAWEAMGQDAATGVYLRCAPMQLDVGGRIHAYTGKTTRFPLRDCEHLGDARCAVTCVGEEERIKEVQWCDEYAAGHGGPGAWIDVPLYVYSRPVLAAELHRLEQTYIRIPVLSVLNGAGARHHGVVQAQLRRAGVVRKRAGDERAKRHRPVKRLCGGVARRGAGAHVAVRVYSSGETESTDICTILWGLERDKDCRATIRVTGEAPYMDASNLTLLARRWGGSAARVGAVRGTLQECVPEVQAMDKGAVIVRDLCVRDAMAARGGAVAAVEYLGRHPGAAKTYRYEFSFRDIERLWGASGAVGDERLRASARGALNTMCRKRYGCSMSTRPVLKIPPLSSKFGQVLKTAAKRVLKYGPAPEVAARLCRRLRVVTTAAPTVGRVLQNWRAVCGQFDPQVPYPCV